jgi:hypothetical protein
MFTCDVSDPFSCDNGGSCCPFAFFSDKLCFYASLLGLPGCLSRIYCLPQPSVSVYCGVACGDSHIMMLPLYFISMFRKSKNIPGHFVHAHIFVNKTMSMLVDPFVCCRIGGFREVNDRESSTSARPSSRPLHCPSNMASKGARQFMRNWYAVEV